MECNYSSVDKQRSCSEKNPVLLYVEEAQNDFINALIERTDIQLVLLRFSNCMSFSKEHLRKTCHIASFVWNKQNPFDSELELLRCFLERSMLEPDYFYNDSEFNQILAQRIARTLGVPGALSEHQAQLVRNKILMKLFVREIGLKCPSFAPIKCLDEAKHFAIQVGYPVIVKWHSGVSSIEVFKIDSEKELEKLPIDFTSGRYIVEEFRNETIWCIDALVVRGDVQDVFYTWLPYTNLDFASNKKKFIQIAVGKKQQEWKFNPHQLTQTIVNGLGTQNGYLHLEVFITSEGEPLVCEFAWRTPGDHIISNLSLLYNTDVAGRLLDGLFVIQHEPLVSTAKCVGDIFFPMKDGRITAISDMNTMREQFPIIAGEIFYCVGDRMKGQHKYTDSGGWVQVAASSIADMLALTDQVYSKFCLRVEKDE